MFRKDLERLGCLETRNEFIARVYDGDTIAEACAMMRLNPAAVGITRRDDIQFDADIRAAQAFRVDMMTDKLESIAEYESCPIMAGVISKNIQWLASKRLRQIYGDKVDVNHNHVINIRDAMDEARKRVTIEHQPNPLITIIDATDTTSAALVEIDPLS